MLVYQRMTGWWLRYTYPSEKWWSERTSWDDDIPFPTEWKVIKHGPNHQLVNVDLWLTSGKLTVRNSNVLVEQTNKLIFQPWWLPGFQHLQWIRWFNISSPCLWLGSDWSIPSPHGRVYYYTIGFPTWCGGLTDIPICSMYGIYMYIC